jgi:DNA modification methylase
VSISLRHARWQDVLPGSYDPARAVVITDPPYGLQANGGTGIRAPGSNFGMGVEGGWTKEQTEKGYEDTIPWSRHVEEVLDLLPALRHAIRGPATALIRRDYPQPRRVCVEVAAYRRRAGTRPGIVPYLWAIYGRLKIERHKNPPTGDGISSRTLLQTNGADVKARRTAHRAITPYASAAWIIDTWVDPGCTVIDPFAGMGTIGLAARAHGFDYLGAEMIEEYASAALEAFSVERMTLGMDAA